MRRRFINNFTDNYLTIVALEDGLRASFSESIEYRVDNSEWALLPAGNYTLAINSGQGIQFRGTIIPDKNGIGDFSISKRCNLKGNVMSMLFGDNAANNTSLIGCNYAFYGLFENCTTIQDVSELLLPATTLASDCYGNMFKGCTSLTAAPELPATTLASDCYSNMFDGCTNLLQAPELPATTLASDCYSNMFKGCTNLLQAPELPATTLANNCYSYMFWNCTNLLQAPELPATTLANNCYSYMFYGCSKINYIKALFTTTPSSSYTYAWVYNVPSIGTFVKNKNATWNVTGISGIPSGWTVQTA